MLHFENLQIFFKNCIIIKVLKNRRLPLIFGRDLSNLGVKQEELTELNDKWIALFYKQSSDSPTIMRYPDGKVIAEENLIDLQAKLPEIDPMLNSPESIRKHVAIRHIPKTMDHLLRF